MIRRTIPKFQQRLFFIRRFVLLCFLSLINTALAATLTDVIRTGGPSKPDETKIAVIVSQSDYTDKPFTIIDKKGVVVFKGQLKKANNPEPWAYAATADFSSVKLPGSYTVQVEKLKSRAWEIDKNAGNGLIPILLGLFQANRDGYEPSPLHKPAHLHDATVMGGRYDKTHLDLTGGWMDAGDQIHFTDTTAYAAILLQIAAKLDPANAKALQNEADVGIRWLLKAHPESHLFIGQVGDVSDHALGFRDPAKDDQSKLPGIGYRLAYPTKSSGILGKTSAALAFAAERSTGKKRTKLLRQARQWYQQGKNLHAAEQLLGHFYDDFTWHDDMSLAAVMLWRLTGKDHYLKDAYDYLDDNDHTLSVAAVGVLAAADLCGALDHPATKNIKTLKRACEFLQITAQESIELATTENAPWETPGRLIWGQTGFNGAHGAMIVLAKRVNLIEDASVAVRARDWLLGLNPWGASFVVGYGPDAPTTPHHWASVFGDNLPNGAVVGGAASSMELKKFKVPTLEQFDSHRAVYSKKAENYITSEPSIVTNADSILLMAALNADLVRALR